MHDSTKPENKTFYHYITLEKEKFVRRNGLVATSRYNPISCVWLSDKLSDISKFGTIIYKLELAYPNELIFHKGACKDGAGNLSDYLYYGDIPYENLTEIHRFRP